MRAQLLSPNMQGKTFNLPILHVAWLSCLSGAQVTQKIFHMSLNSLNINLHIYNLYVEKVYRSSCFTSCMKQQNEAASEHACL